MLSLFNLLMSISIHSVSDREFHWTEKGQYANLSSLIAVVVIDERRHSGLLSRSQKVGVSLKTHYNESSLALL